MTPQDWERLKILFDEALEKPRPERPDFVARLREREPSLAAELAMLLEQHESPSMPLGPAPVTPAHTTSDSPAFRPGQMLAERYRVLRFIAHGGMGEVYEAEDCKLGGTVAVKTLRDPGAASRSAGEGFLREIRTARLVTHPNVCRLHDLAEHRSDDGGEPVLLFTMELLQGETLAAYLVEHGPMEADQALPLISHMGEGLAAAHSAGVIHGDLKPGNVMLVPTPDGPTKAVITDFGLARPLAGGSVPVVGGTPEYMAPEAYREGRITAAADVYSFGKTVERMAKLPSNASKATAWRQVLDRCCAPDPDSRFVDPRAAARELTRILHPAPSALGLWAAAAVVLIAVVVLVTQFPSRPATGLVNRKVGESPMSRWTGSVTPDGRAFVAADEFGNLGLFSLETGAFTPLTESRLLRAQWFGGFMNGGGVAFSPDGRAAAYLWSDGKRDMTLRTVPLRGGPVRVLANFGDLQEGYLLDWSPRHRILMEVVPRGGKCEVAEVETNTSRVIRRALSCPQNAVYHPDGIRILAQHRQKDGKRQADITEVDLVSGSERAVIRHPASDTLVGLTPNRRELIFASDRRGTPGLWTIAWEGNQPREPVELLAGWSGSGTLGFSRAGSLYYRRLVHDEEVYLTHVDLESGRVEGEGRRIIPEVAGGHYFPEWSRDGSKLVFRHEDGPAAGRQAVLDLASGRVETTNCRSPLPARIAQWDAKGRHLVGPGTDASGTRGYYECDPATGQTRMIADQQTVESGAEGVWSPDGSVLYNRFGQWSRGIYSWKRGARNKRILYVPPEGTEIGLDNLAVSPDGRWLVFHARRAAAREALVMLMPVQGGAAQPVFRIENPATFPFAGFTWAPDSRSLLAAVHRGEAGELWQVSIAGGDARRLQAPPIKMRMVRLNRDGRTLAYVTGTGRDEIWVLQNLR